MFEKFLRSNWSNPATRFVLFLFVWVTLLIFSESYVVALLSAIGITATLPAFLGSQIIDLGMTLGILYLFVRFFEREKLVDFGFSPKNLLVELLLGVVCGALLVVGVVLGMYCFGAYIPIGINSSKDLILSASALFFAAATEELIFRSYALNILERRWGTIAAVIVSSLGFGFAHMVNHVRGASVADMLLFCTFLSLEAGLSLAACYCVTRRLWMPIGAHWMWNFFEGPVFGTHVSGADFGQSLVKATVSGPPLFTGGGFGPEGNIISLVLGTVSGVIILYIAGKRKKLISLADAQKHLAERHERSAEIQAA